MKKLGLLFAASIFAASASAQTVAESKTFDNIYIGINGGVATKTTINTNKDRVYKIIIPECKTI